MDTQNWTGFQWDEANIEHLAWHDVTPEEAEDVFYGAYLERPPQIADGEQRTIYVGRTDTGRVLTVVWTARLGQIRVITAFPASLRDVGALERKFPHG